MDLGLYLRPSVGTDGRKEVVVETQRTVGMAPSSSMW